jgi:PDZ domain-containing protein
MDTVKTSVPLPPPLPPPEVGASPYDDQPDTTRRLWWALPVLTVAALAVVAVLIASLIPVQRWQQAPGSALPVATRLEVQGATRYATDGTVLFVTATGSQMSLLGWLVGSLDDDVEVLTYEQRFGPRTPLEQRRIGFQSMFGSKQVAEYVAARLLGLPASFLPGPAVVAEAICDDDPLPTSACRVLEVGDTIVALDGQATPTLADVPTVLAGRLPGEDVVVTVRAHQRSDEQDRTLTLVAAGDGSQRAILGFRPADTRTVELPFDIDIDTSQIGGPSAGLAFTLALIEELSPGALTGTAKVAATGTIAEDGSVGPVGAVRQKAVAVARAGADVMLVPAGTNPAELAEIRRSLGESLQLIEVATILDALEVLEALGGDLSPLQLDGLVAASN